MPEAFIHPPVAHIDALKAALTPHVKHDYKFGYEIEFITTKAREAYDTIRHSDKPYVDEYTSSRSRYTLWQVKHDRSIQCPRDGASQGVEIVSPPVDLAAGVASLFCAFDWMAKHGATTNNSCGLHVSISLKDHRVQSRVNPLALIHLFDEAYYLRKWGRIGNNYCRMVQPAVSKWFSDSIEQGSLGLSGRENITNLSQYIGQGITKHHTINMIKLGDGYLEFRLMGGTDYEKKRDLVLDTIVAILKAYDASIDAPAPAAILKQVDDASAVAAAKLKVFQEKVAKAGDIKKENRKLLGEIHRAANQFNFVQNGSQEQMARILDSLKERINVDADQRILQGELQRYTVSLREIAKIRKQLTANTPVAAA